MADYPTIPDPPEHVLASRHAVQVLRATKPEVAKPSTRVSLEAAAQRLERAMAGFAGAGDGEEL